MKNLFFVFALLAGIIIYIGNIVIIAQTDMKPPVAKKQTRVTKINGYELKDDYFWLRDKNTLFAIDIADGALRGDYTAQSGAGTGRCGSSIFSCFHCLFILKPIEFNVCYEDNKCPFK